MEHTTGARLFVYSQFNLSYVCFKPCTDSVNPELVCTAADTNTNNPVPRDLTLDDDSQTVLAYSVLDEATIVAGAMDKDAHLISGGGDDTITGTAAEF